MTWSTQQLATLAGTTRRAVRHYHDVGLLAEPDRTSSGLRQYGVSHLVRVIRIRRLAELGMPLPQIADLDDDEFPAEALEAVHAELGATIESLQNTQRDLETILERPSSIDQPSMLAHLPRATSRADRALTVVISRVLTPEASEAWVEFLPSYVHSPVVQFFDALPETTPFGVRSDLSLAMSDHVQRLFDGDRSEGFRMVQDELAEGGGRRQKIVNGALADLFGPAQRDVLRRMRKVSAVTSQPH